MNAKDMFEMLGYTYQYEKKHQIITYSYEDWAINFDLKNRIVGLCNMGSYCELIADDIQAINKQVEELGWNND